MVREPELRTERLIMRRWRPQDLGPFAALNADPVVMEHFHRRPGPRESAEFVDRAEAEFEQRGYGLWAVEVPGAAPFIGFVGLHDAVFAAPFTPAVEVGWRLAASHWHMGYATEAAAAAIAFGFGAAGLSEIVSFTSTANVRSQRVMERIGICTATNPPTSTTPLFPPEVRSAATCSTASNPAESALPKSGRHGPTRRP